MKSSFHKSFLACIFLALLILPTAFAPTAISAQTESNGISLTVRPGFDGIVKRGKWLPIWMVIENNGVSVEGELRIQIGDSGNVWKTDVSLPNQSRKQFTVPIYSPGFGRSITVAFVDESGEELVKYSSGPLSEIDPADTLLYAVISPEPTGLDVLSRVWGSRIDSAVAYMSLDEIPVNVSALEAVDVLIFTDIDTNVLSAEQRETINDWTKQGGQLVLTGGASWQKTTAAFQDVLPVDVIGTESIDQLTSFESSVGIDFRDSGPYVVARSTLKNGDLIWRDEALPILARRPEGAGNVWFLALDPQFAPLDAWDGSVIMWDAFAEYVPQDLFWERGFDDENSAVEAVSTIPSVQLPSIYLVLGFMLLYVLIVGPLNYLVLSRMKRRELAWISLPLTILLFSAIALIIGLQFRGNQVLINQLSVVSGRVDQPTLKTETAIGIFSPRRADYNVTINNDANIRFLNQFAFGGLTDLFEVTRDNGQISLENLVIDVGDVESFASSTYQASSPILAQAVLQPGGDKVDLKITNVGDESLQNILLLVGGSRQVKLDDIAPGGTVSRELSLPTLAQENVANQLAGQPDQFRAQGSTNTTDTYQESPLENGFSTLVEGGEPGTYYETYGVAENYQRYSLLSSLYQTYNSQVVYTPVGKLVFIGWDDSLQLDIAIDDGRFENRGASLYFIEIPIEN